MIDLTPLDVRKKKADFRKGLRGYETAEVDAFLELVAERMEELVRENVALKDRSATLAEPLEGFRSREAAMNEALVSAQQLREEIRKQAEREAELLLRESRAEGERLIAEARRELERQEGAAEKVKSRRDRFLRTFRTFLEGQLDELTREEERIVRARTGELEDEEERSV